MMIFEELTENDIAWYLPTKPHKKIIWKKREKIPQEIIDLMNGKKVKMKVNTKDWKGCYGSTESFFKNIANLKNGERIQ